MPICISTCAQTAILLLTGNTSKYFARDQWVLRDRECQQRVAFILVVSIAPLASNLSLALNSVATYQLFKLLQTPLLACAEAISGFRALSLTRGALMVGVSAGVAFAELGGEVHGAEKTTKAAGIFWALAAVVATSTCKLTSAMVVRSGTKPSQFLLDNLPFASVLLMAYAAIFEPDAVRQMTQSWEDGGLGFHGWAVFVASGVVSYFLQFSQAVAIGTTSALTHALTGQAKTASMMVLAPILYGEITSPSQFIGGAAAMACLVLYVYVNVNEMNHLTDGVKEKKDREEPAASRQA